MSKKFALFLSVLTLLVVLAACGNAESDEETEAESEGSEENGNASEEETSDSDETKMFTTDSGEEVEVPADPERIVVLHPTYIGALVKFGHPPVGVPEYITSNEVLNEATEDIDTLEYINPDDLEQISNLDPDLIVTHNTNENLKQLQKIAPTVTIDATISDHIDNTLMLGELVNEEEQAEQWVEDWNNQLEEDKEKYADQLGGRTATIFQADSKEIGAASDRLGRGGEILYDAYDLALPEQLESDLGDELMLPISQEDLPTYAGDIIILATEGEVDLPFTDTPLWNNLEAVKNDRVIPMDLTEVRFNDPLTLERQREIIIDELENMN